MYAYVEITGLLGKRDKSVAEPTIRPEQYAPQYAPQYMQIWIVDYHNHLWSVNGNIANTLEVEGLKHSKKLCRSYDYVEMELNAANLTTIIDAIEYKNRILNKSDAPTPIALFFRFTYKFQREADDVYKTEVCRHIKSNSSSTSEEEQQQQIDTFIKEVDDHIKAHPPQPTREQVQEPVQEHVQKSKKFFPL